MTASFTTIEWFISQYVYPAASLSVFLNGSQTANDVLYRLPLFLFPESSYLASLTPGYKPDPCKDAIITHLPSAEVDGAMYHVLEDVTSTELDALMSVLNPSYVYCS